MAVAFGTVQIQYGGATNTITTGSFSPSAGVAVAFVGHNQSGITNTGVSSSVDGAFTSAGTRVVSGTPVITGWQLQSLSASSMTCSATFSDTWGTASHLAVHPATGAHASSAFGDWTTASGTSTTPGGTVPNFSSGDGVVDCFHGGGGGTDSTTGNNVEVYSDTTSITTAGSTNTTDGVMTWSIEFSGGWVWAGIRIIQAAASGVTGTIAVTLSDFTSSITASGGTTGSMAVTLSSFTSAISGAKTIVGTIAQTLADFTSAITGTKTITGTISQTLSDFTSSMAGLIGKTGTISVTLSNFTSNMSGTVSGIVGAGTWLLRMIGNKMKFAARYLTTAVRRNRNNG